MKRFSKYAPAVKPQHIGQGAVIALGLSVLFLILFQVSAKAELQSDNSAWAAFANDFITAQSGTTTKLPVAARPFDIADLQTFTPAHIKKAVQDSRELDCLTTAIYYEARSEPVAGRLAVAQVVLNRVASKHYPSSICAVVYQGSKRETGCQFSFTCDGSLNIAPRDIAWQRSHQSALNAVLGMNDIAIGRATHYHTVAISPKWSNTLLRTADVGSHIFYRFPNRREKALLAKEI